MSKLHSYSIFSNVQASMLYQAKSKHGTQTERMLNKMIANRYSNHPNTYYLYDGLDSPLTNHAYSNKKQAVRASTIKAVQLTINPDSVLNSTKSTIHEDQKYVLGHQIHPFVAKVTQHTLHTYLNGQSLQTRIAQDHQLNHKINADYENINSYQNPQNARDKQDYKMYKKTGQTKISIFGMQADYTKEIHRYQHKLNQYHQDIAKKQQVLITRKRVGNQNYLQDRQRKQPIYNIRYKPRALNHGSFSSHIRNQSTNQHKMLNKRPTPKHKDKQLSLNLNGLER